jgi:hypothetical protein
MKKSVLLIFLFSSVCFAGDDYEPGNESRNNHIRQAAEQNLYDLTRDRRRQIRLTLEKIRRINFREKVKRLILMKRCVEDCSCTCIHDLIRTPPTDEKPKQEQQQPEQPNVDNSEQHIPELREAEDELKETGETKAIAPKPALQQIPELEDSEKGQATTGT